MSMVVIRPPRALNRDRHGDRRANALRTNTVEILAGDFLFARASDLSAKLGVEVTRIMADTLARLCEGQIAEVQGSVGELSDDLIDRIADPEVSGKVPGTDLREGVRTLPVLYALEAEAEAGGDELARLLDGELDDADVARALALLLDSPGLARARAEAAERVDAACAHLTVFGERKVVTALERLAHYALDRLG